VTNTLAERSYQALRSAIASGELAPGTKITERGLAERIGVSSTPIREAIRRLELAGLVQRLGPRTLVVAGIDEAAVRDLAEMEAALRGLVARFAARRATADDHDALDRLLDDADDLVVLIQRRRGEGRSITTYVDRILDVLANFNARLNVSARNPVLLQLIEQTRSFSPLQQRTLTKQRIEADEEFGADRYTGHRKLVHALRERDAETAERIAAGDTARALLDLRHSPQSTTRP
jgi:DNA-binding GntR family transcriptional regulator